MSDQRPTYPQRVIAELLAELGVANGYDPRHIEGYMRLGHDTLDGLSAAEWSAEVSLCIDCIAHDGPEAAEANAKSYGL